jgi:hypothetical protein
MVDDLLQRLETTPPGPDLAVLMARVDRSTVDGSGAITLAQARARQIAHEQAELLADIAEVGRVDWHTPEGVVSRMSAPDEFSIDRIAWTLRWSRPAAQAQLHLADDLIDRLPVVYTSLQAGRIDLPRARVFHEVLLGVDDTIAHTVVARLIAQAPQWTCARLRERLRYHLHKADPAHAARRYRQAVANREVRAGSSHDGTGYLSGSDLPIDRAAAADDYLTRLARAAKACGDPRTLQQLRADAYLDLLTGIAFQTRPSRDPITHAADQEDRLRDEALQQQWAATPNPPEQTSQVDSAGEAQRWVPASAVADSDDDPLGTAEFASTAADTTIRVSRDDEPLDARLCCTCGGVRPADRRGVVTLTMTLPTLIGLADDPAVLPAWGPVLAEIARHVALDHTAKPSWQFAITDDDGRLQHSGPIRRRPRTADLRHTRLRDRTCRAPYCRRPATACDTDHRRSHASGGTSTAANLDTLCRHHHRLKHDKNLRLRPLDAGAYRWHAPNGEHWDVPADRDHLLTDDYPQ